MWSRIYRDEVMDFSEHPIARGMVDNARDSKWVVLDPILKHWPVEVVEEAVLTCDPYWIEQMGLSALNNKGEFISRFSQWFYIYEDGAIELKDVIKFAKKYKLKCAEEFIGVE